MYSKVRLENVDRQEVDGIAPTLRSIGYDLRPDKMRPSVWEYDAGETNNRHRQEQQEELYVVLDGSFDVTVERDGDRDVVELRENDFLVVPPESWRQLEAREDGALLVVGAPNVKDDGIVDS